MNKLPIYNCFFVFIECDSGHIELLDERMWTDRNEVEKICRNDDLSSAMRYLKPGRTVNAKARYMCQTEIKTRPLFLKAFARFFGQQRIELQKNDAGKYIGFRVQGIPKGADLRKIDLRLIASMHGSSFLPMAKLMRRKKIKAA